MIRLGHHYSKLQRFMNDFQCCIHLKRKNTYANGMSEKFISKFLESATSVSLMTSGGARRITFPWVGLANSPVKGKIPRHLNRRPRIYTSEIIQSTICYETNLTQPFACTCSMFGRSLSSRVATASCQCSRR